jgi:hypothetical protein
MPSSRPQIQQILCSKPGIRYDRGRFEQAGGGQGEADMELSAENREEIRLELERILASQAFRRSRRCSRFLRFVVEKALAGEAETLKERTLALALFDLPADADLERDSSVRVCASEVRKRLAAYYSSTEAGGGWRIELPVGSYVPVFHRAAAEAPGEDGAVAVSARNSAGSALSGSRVLALSAIGLALLALWLYSRSSPDAILRFWQPAVNSRGGVEILMASLLSSAAAADASASNAANAVAGGASGALQAAAAAEIAHYLRSRGARVRIGDYREPRMADAADKAIIVLGASVLRGPHSWMQEAPVRLRLEDDGQPFFVSETGEIWPKKGSPGKISYCAIYRILAEKQRPFLVILGGLEARACEAVARQIVHSAGLARLVKDAAAGWERKNLVILAEVDLSAPEPAVRPVMVRQW